MKTKDYVMALCGLMLVLASCTSESHVDGRAQCVLGKRTYAELETAYYLEDFFSDGMLLVQDKKTEKVGFVNPSGKLVIKCQYDRAADFSEGMAKVLLNTTEDVKEYGFINKKGKVCVSGLLLKDSWREEIAAFSCGMARIKTADNGLIFIDKEGNTVIDTCFTNRYANVYSFSDGLALVAQKIKGRWYDTYVYGYIDTECNEVIPCTFDEAGSFENGVAMTSVKERWRLIDKTGEFVSGAYYRMENNYGGYVWANKNERKRWSDKDQWCLLNSKGEELFVLPSEYVPNGVVSEGFAVVVVKDDEGDDLYGYVNLEGEIAIPCIYNLAYAFKDGMAWVHADRYWGYIDTKGQIIED